VKPSQRIYQQRDIAQNKMDYYAELIANELAGVITNDEITSSQIDRSSEVSERWALEFIKWRTITHTLSQLGGRASNEEQQERKAREKKHKEYVEACERDLARTREELKDIQPEVVEEVAKNVTHDKFFADYVQGQLDKYFATTNAVTVNTTNATSGTTWKFTIPRDANSKVAALPQPGPAQGSQMVEEQEVEGIV
jgi:hypothetical protein